MRRFLPSLLVLLGVATPALAAEQRLLFTGSLTSEHNDNFLEYSDNQLQTFKNGTHPLRFAVGSTDDGIFSPGASLTWEIDEGNGRRHALRAHWLGDFHAANPGADYRTYSGRWTESFANGRRVQAGVAKLDNFYVRQLRDEDLAATLGDARWQRAQFDETAITGSWREPLGKRANVGLAYRHEERTYEPGFTERTASANQGLLSLGWTELPRRGEIEFAGGYRALDADATDGDPIVGDDDDVSYHGFLGSARGRMQLGRSARTVRWMGDLGFDLETRDYTSDRPTDPFHFGRNDTFTGIEAGIGAAWRRWDARGWFRVENNNASLGTSASPTSDSGSYHLNRFGIDLSWSGTLWSAAGGHARTR
jgi:hypothetical protein